jgi:hypothetical protein
MNGTVADPHNPRLCIWKTLIKLSGSNHRIVRNFKRSGFDVDRYNFAVITFFDLRWRSLP